ncbi:hypothetical protein [Streptoalloteichus hindustanus]|uniref:MYXO-CTERM domain-containing protein n=1 Tax=Streptoalloteichus hindustanus TaxID=2017 RepID=A0A1M5QD93_STRHI|nr:hypothetical protein [Streptoalloteichus hindustanus]SHH11928.1 hypothetical protein SAMN05444320_12330 [Streptoalloteichus hindustanus]
MICSPRAFPTVTALLASALLLPALTRIPQAEAAEGCGGVLVVVETRAVPDNPGYGTRTGCANDPRDGFDALRQAGFDVTLGTGAYAGGFACAIDRSPRAGCGVVDRDTYWSYWYMLPDTDTWVYSNSGASYRTPPKGSIEAWVWQDEGDNEPPQPRSAVKPPAPPPHQGGTPVNPPPGGGPPDRNPGGDGPNPAPRHPDGQHPNDPAPQNEERPPQEPSGTPTETPSPSSSAPASATSTPTGTPTTSAGPGSGAPKPPSPDHTTHMSKEDTSRGFPWPLAIGIVAALVLAGGVSWQIRRRRS